MFALLSKGRRLKFPIDIMLDLFDKTVVPVLLYGCEVGGYENNIVVDMVFLKFCKYLLGLKSSTPNCMVYGELGSYPVSLTIKIRLIGFWLKLISSPDYRISKQMYNLIYRMHQNNTHQSAWLNCIRQILEQNGFGYVWLDQGLNMDHMYVKERLYSCLQDQFVQEWTGIVDAGRKCTLYKHIKTDINLEHTYSGFHVILIGI